ncbi:hypothetical protein BGX26_010247 [Mortierella sp. AD094]|nr:hypothetical protein BGX26_010247 [Mortierella sp. AD094]
MTNVRFNEEIYWYSSESAEETYEKLSRMSDKEIEAFEKEVTGIHLNTYTFAKLLTENLIKSRYEAMNLPIVIVRPGAVRSAIQEPMPGWSEGLSASIGCAVDCGLGKVQEWAGDENKVFDIIPVDIVTKTLLMAAVGVASGLPEPRKSVPIVNSCSSGFSPASNNMVFSHIEDYWRAVPAPRGRVSDDIRADIYHKEEFPLRDQQRFSKEIDLAETAEGQKYKKMLKISVVFPTVYSRILSNEWICSGHNSIMFDKLAPKELRSGLEDGIDWPSYLHILNMGVREFILGEKVDKSIVVNYKARSLHKFVPMPGQSYFKDGVLARL